MSNTDASDTDPEMAVRQYVLYLEDPNQLRDEVEIQQKTQAVLDAADPIEKLKALAELERVAKIEEGPLREAFVQHAKTWADAHGVPASAFREVRVPDDVLREAGFSFVAGRGRGGGRAPSGDRRQRAKAVPIADIKAWILDQKGTFLLADVMREAGGSPATVRKAVEELIEAGNVERLGPVPDWQGRGRAPVQYGRS